LVWTALVLHFCCSLVPQGFLGRTIAPYLKGKEGAEAVAALIAEGRKMYAPHPIGRRWKTLHAPPFGGMKVGGGWPPLALGRGRLVNKWQDGGAPPKIAQLKARISAHSEMDGEFLCTLTQGVCKLRKQLYRMSPRAPPMTKGNFRFLRPFPKHDSSVPWIFLTASPPAGW